jgi:hypothetical protein
MHWHAALVDENKVSDRDGRVRSKKFSPDVILAKYRRVVFDL